MKLRSAIKICNQHFGYLDYKPHKHRPFTVRKALTIGRRKWKDNRFVNVPDDEELEKRSQIFVRMFAGMLKKQGVELPTELEEKAFDFDFDFDE